MLEKIDIRCKFDPITIAFVEGMAGADGGKAGQSAANLLWEDAE